jgi:hypothetical protein
MISQAVNDSDRNVISDVPVISQGTKVPDGHTVVTVDRGSLKIMMMTVAGPSPVGPLDSSPGPGQPPPPSHS